MSDEVKKEAIKKAVEDEIDASNQAAHLALKTSNSVKRQTSSTNINENKKPATNDNVILQNNESNQV